MMHGHTYINLKNCFSFMAVKNYLVLWVDITQRVGSLE